MQPTACSLLPAADDTTYGTFELARLLGVSDRAPNRWVKSGRVDGFRSKDGKWRITRSSVIKYLEFAGQEVPQSILDPHAAIADQQAEITSGVRCAEADQAYRKLLQTLDNGAEKTVKRRAVEMLDRNLWNGLSVLSQLERIGYLQAAADAVVDYGRLDKERKSFQCHPS